MKNQKEQRHTCIICGKKRNKKYMVKIPIELIDKETINGLNRWICLYTVKKQRNNCIIFYTQRVKQYLQSRLQIIEQFEYDYQN